MNDVLLDVYSKDKGLVKRSIDYVIACMLLEYDMFAYRFEVIKAVAVLLRSKLFKGVINSDYYVEGEEPVYINEELYENADSGVKDRIKQALEETRGIIVLSGDSTVDFYYTKNCGGGTANSEDILGYRLNYLRRVLCRYCGDNQSEKILAVEDIREIADGKAVVFKNEIDNVFRKVKRDDTGRILEVEVFGKTISGKEFMELFNIGGNRVFFAEESIRLKVMGEGLGLGICLKGADSLAEQGMKYMDIIKYYYTGITFKELDHENINRLLKGRTILLDPGHGGSDQGNVHLDMVEKDINLIIALRLRSLLEEMGARVIMTRDSDEDVVLGERVNLINSERPNLFISIHQNSFPSPGINGAEVYCYSGDDEAERFGSALLKFLSDSLSIKNRGIRKGDYYLLRESKVSGVILETMYLTGKMDSMKYNDENYGRIAMAIFKAICSYYGIEG